MSPDPLDLAYLAGIIDADGHISINRSVRKGRVYYGAVIGITGTRREPHDLAASLWGGKVWCFQPANPRHRGVYQWNRQGFSAYTPITDLLPYLRIKAEQARLALDLQENVLDGQSEEPFPWFPADYDPQLYREALVGEIRALNQWRRSEHAAVESS